MNKAPQKAKRPCLSSGCKDFASNKGYCDKHQSRVKQRDRDRGTAHQRGYDAEWKKHRDQFLLEHPLCVECRRKGYVMPATVVNEKILEVSNGMKIQQLHFIHFKRHTEATHVS